MTRIRLTFLLRDARGRFIRIKATAKKRPANRVRRARRLRPLTVQLVLF